MLLKIQYSQKSGPTERRADYLLHLPSPYTPRRHGGAVKEIEKRGRQNEVSSWVHCLPRGRGSHRRGALTLTLALALWPAPASIKAQQNDLQPDGQTVRQAPSRRAGPAAAAHRFFDRTNLSLFAGVAAVRALDYTSTQHFRSQGNTEVLLTNGIVDNKPLFAGIEVAATAASIGVSYWLHRTGHHKLERWVSIVHIGVGTFGDAHNYSLRPPH